MLFVVSVPTISSATWKNRKKKKSPGQEKEKKNKVEETHSLE